MSATDQPIVSPQSPSPGPLGRVGRVLSFAVDRIAGERLTQVASSLTFTTVLAIVPLLAVVLSLFTAFPLFSDFRQALEDYLASNLMPAEVSADIMEYLNQFAQQASRLTAIGSMALIVTSVMLIMTIDSALNDIWHVSRQRPLHQRILVYWAVISLGPLVMGASLWATSILARTSMGLAGDLSPLVNIGLSVLPVLLTGLAFTALFVVVPNRTVSWRDAAIGGFATAIVLETMKAGFAYYISQFPSYTVIYGAFAAVPVFLLWIYLSWLTVVAGAVLTASLPGIRLYGLTTDTRPAGAAYLDTITVLQALYADWSQQGQGISQRESCATLAMHPEDLDIALAALQDLGLAAPARIRGKERWVLSSDPRRTTIGPLIDRLLLTRTTALAQQDGAQLIQATANALGQYGPEATLDELLSGDLADTLAAGLRHDQDAPPISAFLSRPSINSEESHHAKSQ
ncbi:YihY family inner membrane protein [Kerstersia gyiorum]|uniref:UPF0761 membrane protein EV679_1357 n=1 Tax=Kerstersia gyiorum TaxID=206506 RepID=A0A4Q7MQC5_9BURK|nr:YihY family inner membrane protein [Kerstersia gyiorum]AZV93192.1 hypothetical protein CBF45_05245 [Bordetella sp. J329]KAB0543566.1 YihY family inner membrane protein [Kerstersia gyiorum]MCH4272201.1 YihY family inner membrane protein [Kerstersia gyiorum]MCI1228074.1 YihY family inner membrane protein [Kerstersia gyiorum]QBR40165.1 YihY family inner membrane protein [Kerstersia gyiorum]